MNFEIRSSNSNSCIRSGQLKERNSSALELYSWVLPTRPGSKVSAFARHHTLALAPVTTGGRGLQRAGDTSIWPLRFLFKGCETKLGAFETVGTFVHAPIFVTIDTNKVLGLKQGEVVQKRDVTFEQNLLGGKEGDPKIVHYKEQVEREWKKANIKHMMGKAKDSKPKDRARLIQKSI